MWKSSLTVDQQEDATGFFNVIKRHSEYSLGSTVNCNTGGSKDHSVGSIPDLYAVPFSQEYNSFLTRAAELLHKAGDLASSTRYEYFFFFFFLHY